METRTPVQAPAKEMIWTVDSSHSEIGFTAKHMLITTVRGRFTRYDATIDFNPKSPETTKVEAHIEAASIDTREPKRDEHLRSADFFDAEQYPQITFRSKNLQRLADDRWKLTGDLTIRGISKEITLDMEGFTEEIKDPWGNFRVGGTATASLNRFDYGLKWNAAIETGGLIVGEKIQIKLDLSLVRKA
ncbi:MAG TPA: YceI family protein [bacterium]|jgi:polyisoprenoid-binding protein YceI